jgi:hypothetical protein
MRINADDDASIDVYTRDGRTKLCTINCFDLSKDSGHQMLGCIDVIPAQHLKANALVFDFNGKGAPTYEDDGRRYRMTSHGLVAVELNA